MLRKRRQTGGDGRKKSTTCSKCTRRLSGRFTDKKCPDCTAFLRLWCFTEISEEDDKVLTDIVKKEHTSLDIKGLVNNLVTNDDAILKILKEFSKGSRTYVASTHLYPKLMQGGKYNFDNVKTWMKHSESYENFVFPLHKPGSIGHWRACIFSKNTRSCFVLDSLGWSLKPELRNLKKYVRDCGVDTEWCDVYPKTVRQTNGVDCGIHMVLYMVAATVVGSLYCLQAYDEEMVKIVRKNFALRLHKNETKEEEDLLNISL